MEEEQKLREKVERFVDPSRGRISRFQNSHLLLIYAPYREEKAKTEEQNTTLRTKAPSQLLYYLVQSYQVSINRDRF